MTLLLCRQEVKPHLTPLLCHSTTKFYPCLGPRPCATCSCFSFTCSGCQKYWAIGITDSEFYTEKTFAPFSPSSPSFCWHSSSNPSLPSLTQEVFVGHLLYVLLLKLNVPTKLIFPFPFLFSTTALQAFFSSCILYSTSQAGNFRSILYSSLSLNFLIQLVTQLH